MAVLPWILARTQWAFLGRPRAGWAEHLVRARTFLGEGLRRAAPERPVLVLGAGSGLEIPWSLAPKDTTGWDADPLSRWLTLARHRRLAPWVGADLTGGLEALHALARRCARRPGGQGPRDPELALRRLAGLLPGLAPVPRALEAWLERRRPGTILAANVLGQLGPVAQAVLERGLGRPLPEGEIGDAVQEALDAWTARAQAALLDALKASGAELWLLHDRAVLDGRHPVGLGPFSARWSAQLRATGQLELMDPLNGLDVVTRLEDRTLLRGERWFWPLGPGQRHLVEALAVAAPVCPSSPGGPYHSAAVGGR
jgi:hypothetical protein